MHACFAPPVGLDEQRRREAVRAWVRVRVRVRARVKVRVRVRARARARVRARVSVRVSSDEEGLYAPMHGWARSVEEECRSTRRVRGLSWPGILKPAEGTSTSTHSVEYLHST